MTSVRVTLCAEAVVKHMDENRNFMFTEQHLEEISSKRFRPGAEDDNRIRQLMEILKRPGNLGKFSVKDVERKFSVLAPVTQRRPLTG